MSTLAWSDGYPSATDMAEVVGPADHRVGLFRRALQRLAVARALCLRHGVTEHADPWHWARGDSKVGPTVWIVARTSAGCTVRYVVTPGGGVRNVGETDLGVRYNDAACFVCASRDLSGLARERDEYPLYEAIGPDWYARYLTWGQTPHSLFTDADGKTRNVLEDARGEALPSDPTEFNELRRILGGEGYEIWRTLPPAQ